MGIYVRRGMEADFDPEKMKPGEWAVSINSDRKKRKYGCALHQVL